MYVHTVCLAGDATIENVVIPNNKMNTKCEIIFIHPEASCFYPLNLKSRVVRMHLTKNQRNLSENMV